MAHFVLHLTRNEGRRRWRLRRAALASGLVVLLLVAAGVIRPAVAQQQPPARRRTAATTISKKSTVGVIGPTRAKAKPAGSGETVAALTRALAATCRERELDPLGSVPIDVMQARPSLPLRHPAVANGVERAERLLPLAQALAAESLGELARGSRAGDAALRAGLARVRRVTTITPDMELRDNASVLFSEPRAIRFGTLFLAGLNSDEGMLSVLAHELTHVADGPRGSLASVFRAVARRAGRATPGGARLSAQRAEELACDLVGVMAARLYIERTPTTEPLARRAARAIEHNCVEQDATDAAHLSPRATMRALLALAPALAREITGEIPPPPSALQTLVPTRPNRRRATTTHHVPR